MLKFMEYTRDAYPFLKRVLCTEKLFRRIFYDLFKEDRNSLGLLLAEGIYSLKEEANRTDLISADVFTKYIFILQELKNNSFMRSQSLAYTKSSESTGFPSESSEVDSKSVFSSEHSSHQSRSLSKAKLLLTTELQGNEALISENDSEFIQKLKWIARNGLKFEGIARQDAISFFSLHTISRKQRRMLWFYQIGNKLKITRRIYVSLLKTLRLVDFPKKVDRVIIGDLNRTLPDFIDSFEDGTVFHTMLQNLRLFHLYRPDIQYVQGMTYLLLMLMQYFDDYESFALFCNLVINKRFLLDLYKFDLAKVGYI